MEYLALSHSDVLSEILMCRNEIRSSPFIGGASLSYAYYIYHFPSATTLFDNAEEKCLLSNLNNQQKEESLP